MLSKLVAVAAASRIDFEKRAPPLQALTDTSDSKPIHSSSCKTPSEHPLKHPDQAPASAPPYSPRSPDSPPLQRSACHSPVPPSSPAGSSGSAPQAHHHYPSVGGSYRPPSYSSADHRVPAAAPCRSGSAAHHHTDRGTWSVSAQ